MKDVFPPLKLFDLISNQVAQLVKVVSAVHKDLELLHSQNSSLSQHLIDYTSSTLKMISQSFQNDLEQIWKDQVVIDGKVVSLQKKVCQSSKASLVPF